VKRRFPIPILWVYFFTGFSLFVLFLMATVIHETLALPHPGRVVAGAALLEIPLVFFGLHRVCSKLEALGWIHYAAPKTGGLAAGTLLDLEILVSGRSRPVECVRMAREALTEGGTQEGEADLPPEKASTRKL
jgi:hypothetical protein